MNKNQIASDPAAFRERLLVETPAGLRPLASVADPRQAADFAATDAALRIIAGLPTPAEPAVFRHWWERCRGSSKTQDAGVLALWLLCFARRCLQLIVVAADQGQAGLLSDALQRLLRANPWLPPIDATRWQAMNQRTGSRLTIESSDAPSSFGWLPDLVLADEVSMWSSDVIWQSIMSAAGKRPACMVLAAMNSGYIGSWPHALRQKIEDDPAWRLSRWDGPAAWITEEALGEQRRLLRPGEFARLWENRWVPSLSDALPGDQLDRAVKHAGPLFRPCPPWRLGCIGVDLGHSIDHSAVVYLAGDPESQRIRVGRVLDFRPYTPFSTIGRAILDLARQFGISAVSMDQWQAISLAESLRAAGLVVTTIPATVSSNARQCTTLLASLRDGTLELYDDPDLLADLRSCQIEERPSGPRLIFAHDDRGHGDRASALCLALVALAEVLPMASEEAMAGGGPGTIQVVPGIPMQVPDVLDAESLHQMLAERDRYEAKLEMLRSGW